MARNGRYCWPRWSWVEIGQLEVTLNLPDLPFDDMGGGLHGWRSEGAIAAQSPLRTLADDCRTAAFARNRLSAASLAASAFDAVDGSSAGIPTSGNGTQRKCHRRPATSGIGAKRTSESRFSTSVFDPERTWGSAANRSTAHCEHQFLWLAPFGLLYANHSARQKVALWSACP